MKQLLTLLGILVGLSVNAQNLIPNPSFEDLTECPTGAAQVRKAVPWRTPTTKTPDLFNSCAGVECNQGVAICVPINFAGDQEPRTGNGYIGFYHGVGDNNREYIQVPLKSTLVAGEPYILSYYISRGDRYSIGEEPIGVYLTPDTLFSDTNLYATPQLFSPPGPELGNENTWTLVRDTFIAVGNESFMTLGNFIDDTHLPHRGTYYYFDDFKLVHATENLFIEGESTICQGESTTLKALNGDIYNWIDSLDQRNIISNESQITVSPTKTTTYTVFAGDCFASFRVNVETPLEIDLGNDTTLCDDDELRLDVAEYEGNYLWSDNSTNSTFTINTPGTYDVKIENICGSYSSNEITVETKECNCPLFFPNSFSPNADGINDFFFPVFDCVFDEYELLIYNRWGNLVFQTNTPTDRWNGSSKGTASPLGVYVYVLKFKSQETRKTIESGSITLIR